MYLVNKSTFDSSKSYRLLIILRKGKGKGQGKGGTLMSLLDDLIEAFLFNNEEISSVYNRVTKEVLINNPESDSEATKDLVVIPQISSTEAYDLMVLFANDQEEDTSDRLLIMLKERGPIQMFKDKLHTLELGNEWYAYENGYAKNKMTIWLSENE